MLRTLLKISRRTLASYVSCPSSSPLLPNRIGDLVDRAVREWPDREAFVSTHEDLRVTYAGLKRRVDDFAAGLLTIGLRPGDRVGIWAPNCFHWFLSQVSIAKAGMISVNVNPAYQAPELEHCLRAVQVRAIVAATSFKTLDYREMLQQVVPETALEYVIMMSQDFETTPGYLSVDEVSSRGHNDAAKLKLEKVSRCVQFDDPANIQFTSGTTGWPKGAVLSHHNVVNNAFFLGKRIGYDKKYHKICLPVPLYHCFGCVAGTVSSLLHGGTVVVCSSGFDAEAALKAVEAERCTSLYGTPTMFIDMLNLPTFSDHDLSSLETGAMAGSPCPEPLVKEVREKMHMKDFSIFFGMTETSPVSCQTFPTDSVDTRATTVGFPSDHTEVMVIDNEGRTVERGIPGELLVRGYLVFLGYWNDPEKTSSIFTSKGWLRTGDLVVMHESGYVSVVGRLKDTIIRGGENLYPTEIETYLLTHPEIAEAHVVGVPDERLGEELCVWIKRKSGSTLSEKGLREFCKGQLAHFKIPRYILFKDSFPVTMSGKIQKFKIREMSIVELQLEMPKLAEDV